MVIEKKEIAGILKNFKDWSSTKLASSETQGILLKGNKLVAYNGNEMIITTINNDTEEEFVIPTTAIDLISSLPAGLVEITKPKTKVVVSSKSAGIKSSFPTLETEMFPEVSSNREDDMLADEHLKIDGAVFDDILSSIFYACPSNSPKPIFNGILINGKSGTQVDFVACDGYRMAYATEKIAYNINVVIPREAIKKLTQIAQDEDKIDIYHLKNKVAIYRNNYIIYSNLCMGEFVNYEAAFPKSFNETISIDKNVFEKAVKRSLICCDKDKGSSTVLSGSGDELTVGVRNRTNEYSEVLSLQEEFSNDIKIGVNGKYLMETLSAISCPTVKFRYVAPTSPMIFSSINDEQVKHMILPMRLKEA